MSKRQEIVATRSWVHKNAAFKQEVVPSIESVQDPSTTTLYLVPTEDGEGHQYSDEYIYVLAHGTPGQPDYIEAHFERIGSTDYVPDHEIADDPDNPGYLVLTIGDKNYAIERTEIIIPTLVATYNGSSISSGGRTNIVTTSKTANIIVTCNNVASATVHYTTDGTNPTVNSPLMPSTLQLSINTGTITPIDNEHPSTYDVTFKARAFDRGRGSLIFTYTFRIERKLKTPTITFTEPGDDQVKGKVQLNAQSGVSETVLYKVGTSGDPDQTYVSELTNVSSNTPYRVLAQKANWTISDLIADIVKFTVKKPTVAVSGSNTGDNSNSRVATITCKTPLCRIYYTIDGSTPTESTPTYKDMQEGSDNVVLDALTSKGSYNVKALAVKTDWNNSSVGASGSFTVKKISAISFGSASGNDYDTSRTVSVTCGTTGAVLNYEVREGSTVISSGTVVSGGNVTLNPTGQKTLKVYVTATKTDWDDATNNTSNILVGKTYTHAGVSTRNTADATTLGQMTIETKADSPTGGAASKKYTFTNAGSSPVYIWFFIPSNQTINVIENDLGFDVTNSFDKSSSNVTIDGRSYKWYRSKTTLVAGETTNYTVK